MILLRPPDDGLDMAAALQAADAKSGVTLLGQAVAWGYEQALPDLLDAIRCSILASQRL